MHRLECKPRRLYDIITKLLVLKVLRKHKKRKYQFRPLPEIIQNLNQLINANDSENLLFDKLMEENLYMDDKTGKAERPGRDKRSTGDMTRKVLRYVSRAGEFAA
jgi:hypothetical protein